MKWQQIDCYELRNPFRHRRNTELHQTLLVGHSVGECQSFRPDVGPVSWLIRYAHDLERFKSVWW